MADGTPRSSNEAARINNERYHYVSQRGHYRYCETAAKLQRFYLGGGGLGRDGNWDGSSGQWDRDDASELIAAGRKPIEMNEVADAVNTALGHQISNRVDIAYRPRGMGADDDTATSLSKVAMQVCDNNDFQHLESDQFADGIIQQRGYLEMTLDFDQNVRGEIRLGGLDPMDVIPDPDSKAYDPDQWYDVTITRWWSLDDIEANYGKRKRREVEGMLANYGDEDWGRDENDGTLRARFGSEEDVGAPYDMVYQEDTGRFMVRIVDRQYWKIVPTKVAVYPTGDLRVIEDATPEQIQHILNNDGMVFKRPMKRVRWCVSTVGDVLLHDKWSPYKHFTVIPFFPFFRRGKTRGLIDNLVAPQEMLNKALSQYLHIINTTANSGWIVEENSLTNLSTDDLEFEGARTGLVVEYRNGATPPKKIEPNKVPTGIDKIAEMASQKIRTVSGISDAMRGQSKPAQSGLAIQSLQFGSQLSLAVPLDNLSRTRRMLAIRMLEMIQSFMTEAQVLRITERGADGREVSTELPINWENDDGSILNNLTIGEYDAVVTEQPSQITFQNSQFQQALELKKLIPNFPDDVLLRYSNLADKNEVIEAIKAARDNASANPLDEARAALALAQATAKNVEALFSAMRTGALLRTDPALAGIADTIAKSAGFQDKDAAPIYPATQAAELPPGAPPPTSSNPLTPDNPEAGADAGMTAVAGGV